MFKITNFLFLFILFFAGSAFAQERPVKKDNVQFLYLIRMEDTGDKNKNYDVIVNKTDWFGKKNSSGVHVVVDLKQGKNFIKPYYVKKVKNK